MKFGIATAGNLTGCRGKRIRGAERAQRKVHKKRLEIPTSLLPTPHHSVYLGRRQQSRRQMLWDAVCTKMLKL